MSRQNIEATDNGNRKRKRPSSEDPSAKRRRPVGNSLQARVEPTTRPQVQRKRKPLQKESCPASYQYVSKFDYIARRNNANYMPDHYVEAIVLDMETNYQADVKENYFETVQSDLKPRMRTILYAWITEVHNKFDMREIVLWQAFQLVDRYLSLVDIKREDYQRLGCAAIWVASKYQEIYPPVAADLVHMSDNAFTTKELIKMEADLCDALGYEFTEKTAYQYIMRYINIALHGIHPQAHSKLEKHLKKNPNVAITDSFLKKAKRIKFLALYGLERYHLTPNAVARPPKHMAAMAVYTALSLTSNKWTDALVRATGFTTGNLRDENFKGGSFHQFKAVILEFTHEQHSAVILKYEGANRGAVSTLRKKKAGSMRK